MKIILFDLGDTLEYKDQNKDVLMPGTKELLSAEEDMRWETIQNRIRTDY
jgi:hypothetical protein